MTFVNYFEDTKIGDRTTLGGVLFTADAIKAFARQFDPQSFHLDEEAAKQSQFGALCASGWHTTANWMKLTILYRQKIAAERQARGEPVAELGPSPGFRDLKWTKPVYAGDTITYATEVVDKRELRSRPGWGVVTCRNTGTNQRGELVLTFLGSVFLQRRPS